MRKEELIARRGIAAYEKQLHQSSVWQSQHRKERNAHAKKWRDTHLEEVIAYKKGWREANPDKVKANNHEICRKGGKYYGHKLKYQSTALQSDRRVIRTNHQKTYQSIKQATPNSVFHHEWIPGTAKYRGVALVEEEAHQHGIIKVIEVLEGKITLLTEKEIRGCNGNA